MDVFCYPQPIVFDKLTSSVKQIETIVLELPEINTSFKAYMDYRTITDEKSLQWEMQQKAYTDEFGLRKIGERYCVAVGTYYAEQCGKVLLITLDDGTQFEVIVSDIKNNIHTDKKTCIPR